MMISKRESKNSQKSTHTVAKESIIKEDTQRDELPTTSMKTVLVL